MDKQGGDVPGTLLMCPLLGEVSSIPTLFQYDED